MVLFGCIDTEPHATRGLILISLDTLRADRVGMIRGGRSITPSIDRFATDGVFFENCYAQAPSTLPSHASIMTSLLPPHHGAYFARKSKLAPGIITIAEVLSQAGYRTVSFNGGAQLDPVWGLDRGFDRYETEVVKRETSAGVVERDFRLILDVEKTLRWLAEDDSRPFFVFLHSFEIHSPYTPSLADVDALGDVTTEGYREHVSIEQLEAINAGTVSVGREQRQQIQDAYNAEIISADRAIGHFVSRLREMGLYEDTMIVFTSDHGEEFGEHGMMGWHSHSLYDELLHVPLIIKFPRRRYAGTRVTTQVRSIDIAPTALGSLGIEIPAQFTGKDLATRAHSGWQWDLTALSYQDTPVGIDRWSLRETRWKLNDGRLFDTHTDAAELQSRLEPSRVRDFRVTMRAMLEERSVVGVTSSQPAAETKKQLRALGYVVE
jgi:arylsulfatase A-like enzyme